MKKGEDAPTNPPTLYVRRTRERLWHWCSSCSQYPVTVLDNNGLLASTTKPAGDLCPECIALTKRKECA